jgi:hypothetical protein
VVELDERGKFEPNGGQKKPKESLADVRTRSKKKQPREIKKASFREKKAVGKKTKIHIVNDACARVSSLFPRLETTLDDNRSILSPPRSCSRRVKGQRERGQRKRAIYTHTCVSLFSLSSCANLHTAEDVCPLGKDKENKLKNANERVGNDDEHAFARD